VVCQDNKATGIITKTDIAKAYKQGLSLETPAANIMSEGIITVNRSLQRDKAATVFAEHKIHHAVVVDNQGEFVGFISAWDCAKEGSLDHQAWPWNRRMMGRRI
jgi:predicted transcriptional regulator